MVLVLWKEIFIMMNQNINSSQPPIPERVDSLFALSSVVNRFIDIKRATIRQGRPETDGEHTLHLQSLAVAYAAEYHPHLELGKVALYAPVHDFIEVYAGDVNSLRATSEEMAMKALREKVALKQLTAELGSIWPTFMQLIERYELLEDVEARFIKTFDKCDPGFSHLESRGRALLELGITTLQEYRELTEVVTHRMLEYAGEFSDVLALRDELQSRIAASVYRDV